MIRDITIGQYYPADSVIKKKIIMYNTSIEN